MTSCVIRTVIIKMERLAHAGSSDVSAQLSVYPFLADIVPLTSTHTPRGVHDDTGSLGFDYSLCACMAGREIGNNAAKGDGEGMEMEMKRRGDYMGIVASFMPGRCTM